jgi:crotonobetainyl-CoA:carnitine CoA-transferase CaiB-like acyl-CoA transferase
MMLKGLKIVEMATYIAAPAAAGIMADWGAEIIKIEPRGGDPIRQFFDNAAAKDNRGNPIFDLDNRSKRSVSIDVSTPEGQALVRRLIAGADVFITNTRPQSLIRAGLDYESLKADFPKLIYGCVTGYGMEGAERDRPGFDMAAFWARSGMAGLTTPKGQEPMPMRTAVGDHTTGLALTAGILAALLERERTGQGRLIETSLLRTGIYCLGSDMAIQLRYGRVASTRPREQAPSPLNSFYKTQDGRWICLLMRQSGDDWQKLTQALGTPELADDPRFNSSRGRRENAPGLIEALDHAFGAVSYDHIKAALDARDLIWAPVQSPAEVVADPQAIAAGAFIDVPDGTGATFRSIATPISTDHPFQPGPVPGPGADTQAILAGLGLSGDEIDHLRAKGIIN